MLFDTVGTALLPWLQLQLAVTQHGTGSILLSIAALAAIALTIDYARMLYLYFRMVSLLRSLCSNIKVIKNDK